jgi:hypothetical protein
MSHVSLKCLADPNDPSFLTSLRQLPDDLTTDDAPRVFETILSHFQSSIGKSKGTSILSVTTELLLQKLYTPLFTSLGFVERLPIGLPDYSDPVFDILMVLVTQAPTLVDSRLTDQFVKQLPLNPRKGLTIIARFAPFFMSVNEPWILTDILFKQFEVFATPDIAADYASLLVFLCHEYSEFAEHRGQNAWVRICELLNMSDRAILKTCYRALFSISKFHEIGLFPAERVAKHLRHHELIDCILPVLLVCASMVGDDQILRQLISAARTNERAILVLFRLARHERNAEALVKNDSWFDSPMPTNADTLKLLFVILGHAQMESLVMESKRLVPLFTRAISDVSFVDMSLIAGILKRLTLTKRFVGELGRAGFFARFVRLRAKCSEESAVSALFDAFRTVARVTFVEEMLEVCELAEHQVKDDGRASALAKEFILAARAHSKCRKKLNGTLKA